MLLKIGFYAALIAIPVAGYFGYDYGATSTKAEAQAAADNLTSRSVVLAEAGEKKKQAVKVVYRDVIRKVEVAKDESECLDARPPAGDIPDGVRLIQSQQGQP